MIVHLNGQLLHADSARISPFDRGFIFGDGVYEGLRAARTPQGRRVIGLARHITRLAEGLATAGIRYDPAQLGSMTDALLTANALDDAFVYWQVTRGTPPAGAPVRARVPSAEMRPTIFGYCTPLPGLDSHRAPAVKAATVQPDLRWLRGGLKSISLLGNIIASLASAVEGGEEAILIREVEGARLVTEGTYTNVIIVGPDGRAATPSLESTPILNGVTRQILLANAPSIEERAIEERELWTAREILLLGTTTMVTSVSTLNGHPVAGGSTERPIATALLRTLLDTIERGEDDPPVSHRP
ncbi:MAG: aminotransferase class IV [Phycisphaerales bacterium]